MRSSPFLLQLQVELPQHNPIIVIAIIAAVAIGIMVFFIATSRRGVSTAPVAGGGPSFSRGRFRRLAAERGMDPALARTLENLVLKHRPSAPMSVFDSSQALDIVLSKAIEDIRRQPIPDAAKEANVGAIYRIKQTMEHGGGRSSAVQSSSQLRGGQTISITVGGGERYRSQIIAKLRDVLAAEIPVDEAGNQVRWKKWTPAQIFFTESGGKGFAFQTKVVGYNSFKGTESVLFQHSNSVSAATQRRFRRRELDRPAYFYAVQIMTVGTGREARKQAVPVKKGALGTILDVSAGGCAIKTTFPLPRGSLVKVEFETARLRQVTVYGKVTNVRKAEPMGGIMHIKFTTISRKNLNSINSFVYDIG